MKALSLTIQKLWPLKKFLWTNKRTNGQAKKNYMPPIYRYGGIKIRRSRLKTALKMVGDKPM